MCDVACDVGHGLASLVFDLTAGVSKVEVKSTVRAEHKSVNAMIVLRTGDAREKDFLLIRFQIAVLVSQDKDVRAGRDDRARSLSRAGFGEAKSARSHPRFRRPDRLRGPSGRLLAE